MQQDRQEHDVRLVAALLTAALGAVLIFLVLPVPAHMTENRRFLPGPWYPLALLVHYSPALVLAGLMSLFYCRRSGGLGRKPRGSPPDPCLPGNPLIHRFSVRSLILPISLALIPIVYFESSCLGVFCYDLWSPLCLALVAPQWTLAAAALGYLAWQYKTWDEIDLLSLRRLRHLTFYGLHLSCYSLGTSQVCAVGLAYTWREEKNGRVKDTKVYLFFRDRSWVELDYEGSVDQMVEQARRLADQIMVPALLDYDQELTRQAGSAHSVEPCELRDWKPMTAPVKPAPLPPVG